MADEEIMTNENEVDVGSEGETSVEEKPETDFQEEIIDGIQERLDSEEKADTPEKEVETDSESEAKDEKPDLDGTDIPDAFTEAAEADGWSVEDIQTVAKDATNEELLELIQYLKATSDGEVKDKPEEKPEAKEADFSDDEKQKLKEIILNEVKQELQTDFEAIKKVKEEQERQRDIANFKIVCDKFDEASKDFKVFGKTKDIPTFPAGRLKGQPIPNNPQQRAREEVFQFVPAFIQMGQSMAEAMDNALSLYKGKHLGKEMHRKAIKDLKEHEQQLSGSRTGKDTRKTFDSSREEMIDFIKQTKRAAGQDV